jgi:hypothetical protein
MKPHRGHINERQERVLQQRYEQKRERDQARKQTRRQQMLSQYAQRFVAPKKDDRA